MENPIFSVVIPATDRLDGFEKCISSALKQDYSHLEVIIVENNSTDKNAISGALERLKDSMMCLI
jgi:glycosyltransferase involved in cell wall biosynthesis